MAPERREFLMQCAAAAVTLAATTQVTGQPPPGVRSLWLGETTLEVINIGDITLPLAPSLRAPTGAGTAAVSAIRAALGGQRRLPMQDVLVRHPDGYILVDASAYDIAPDSPYHVPGYTPPPPLADRLAALGVTPESVRHVVFTHRHWDHFNGAVVAGREGALCPLFPRARHHLRRADWDYVATKLGDPGTRLSRAFGVLHPAGLIDIVERDLEIAPGVRLLATPGETPGHQAVRIASQDRGPTGFIGRDA